MFSVLISLSLLSFYLSWLAKEKWQSIMFAKLSLDFLVLTSLLFVAETTLVAYLLIVFQFLSLMLVLYCYQATEKEGRKR